MKTGYKTQDRSKKDNDMSAITDRKTVKILGDFVREQLIGAVNCASAECECGGDFSGESKSRFIDGWVRRYRKGLREGGAAGLAYRSTRKITCPNCGAKKDQTIGQEDMTKIRDIIANADPIFQREKAESDMAKLSDAQKELDTVSHHKDEVLAQKPCAPVRPSTSWPHVVLGWFNKAYKARYAEEMAAKIRVYEDAEATYQIHRTEWKAAYDAAQAEQVRHMEPLSALRDDIEQACKAGGVLHYLFPGFVYDCAKAIGRPIVQPVTGPKPEPVVRKASAGRKPDRKRGAAGLSVGPGGIRPWVRMGGVGMSFGKSGIGVFARKGPFAIYSKNGKTRVGGRFFRF